MSIEALKAELKQTRELIRALADVVRVDDRDQRIRAAADVLSRLSAPPSTPLPRLQDPRGLRTLAASGLRHAKTHGLDVSLVFADLNRPTPAADGAQRALAECLTAVVRESDVVAHVGGDEFVVLLVTPLETSSPQPR